MTWLSNMRAALAAIFRCNLDGLQGDAIFGGVLVAPPFNHETCRSHCCLAEAAFAAAGSICSPRPCALASNESLT